MSAAKDFHGGGDRRSTYRQWERYDVDAALSDLERQDKRDDREHERARDERRVGGVAGAAARDAAASAGALESRARVAALKAKLRRGRRGRGQRGGGSVASSVASGAGGEDDESVYNSDETEAADDDDACDPAEAERREQWLARLRGLAHAAREQADALSACVQQRDAAEEQFRTGKATAAEALFRAALSEARGISDSLAKMRSAQELMDEMEADERRQEQAQGGAGTGAGTGAGAGASAGAGAGASTLVIVSAKCERLVSAAAEQSWTAAANFWG